MATEDLRAGLTRHAELTRGWQQVQAAVDARASAEPGSRTHKTHDAALKKALKGIDAQNAPHISHAIATHIEVHGVHQDAMKSGAPEDYVNKARRAKSESIQVVGRMIKKEHPTLTEENFPGEPTSAPAAPKETKAPSPKPKSSKTKASPYSYIKTRPGAVKPPLGEQAFDLEGNNLGHWNKGQQLSTPKSGTIHDEGAPKAAEATKKHFSKIPPADPRNSEVVTQKLTPEQLAARKSQVKKPSSSPFAK